VSPRPPESPELDWRKVLPAVLATFALLGVSAGAVWWLYPTVRVPVRVDVTPFPEPALETQPVVNYVLWRAAQEARLDGAEGWMPIEAAMAEIAARGPAAFDPLAPTPAGGSAP
jgi:hypothetical protein